MTNEDSSFNVEKVVVLLCGNSINCKDDLTLELLASKIKFVSEKRKFKKLRTEIFIYIF